MSCVGAVLVCRFRGVRFHVSVRGVRDCVGAVDGIVLTAHSGVPVRGVRDCFGAVDGIGLAAHNALRCALMYLFAAFFNAFGAFAAWFAAFFYMGNLRDTVPQICVYHM